MAYQLENMWLKVRPKKTAHALNSIADMVRRRDVDSVPAKALAYDPSFLLHEFVVRKLVIDLSLKMTNSRLALILLIEFGGE